MSETVAPEEVRDIQAALDELRSEPPPTDSGPLGCLVAIVAVIGLVVLPIIADQVGLPVAPLSIMTLVLAVSIPAGLIWSFVGGAFGRRAFISGVERAITELIELHPHGSSDRMLALATRIIRNATVSTGPATTHTFDAAEVAERLGSVLPYVVRVERWLVEHEGMWTVFTSDDQDEA